MAEEQLVVFRLEPLLTIRIETTAMGRENT